MLPVVERSCTLEEARTVRIITKFECDASSSASVICDTLSSLESTRNNHMRETPPDTTRAMMLALSASSGVTRSRDTMSRQPSHVYENGT